MPRNAPAKTATKTAAKSSRAAKDGTEVLALLKEDHDKVKKMFKQFEKLMKAKEQDEEAKQKLIETTCAELTIHAQVEEEIFYPALREVLDEADLLDEAEVEHASAKQLITELSTMQPGDELYDAKFTVLGEYVNHHVEEEEKEMFPKAKKNKVALQGLAEEIMQRKMELREELGLASEDEDEQDEEPRSRKNVH